MSRQRTLPAKTVLAVVAACLEQRREDMRRLLEENKRGCPDSKAFGRREAVVRLTEQIGRVRALRGIVAQPDFAHALDAEAAAYLIALASGYTECAGDLDDRLAETKHRAAKKVLDLHESDVPGLCDALFGYDRGKHGPPGWRARP